MGKLKCNSILHLPNLFWMKFTLDDTHAVLIDKMVKTFDKGYPGKEGLVNASSGDSPSEQLKRLKVYLTTNLSKPDENGAYGILLTDENTIDLILLKNHPLFESIMSYFTERAII